jgi:hypothetical protein
VTVVSYVYPLNDVEPFGVGMFPGLAGMVVFVVVLVISGVGATRSRVGIKEGWAVALPTSQSLFQKHAYPVRLFVSKREEIVSPSKVIATREEAFSLVNWKYINHPKRTHS